MTAADYIERYRLQPHPEGGWFREFHRSGRSVGIPEGYPGTRSALTAIYFLLAADDFSAFHRVRSEEVWVYVAGDPLQIVLLDGALRFKTLGPATGGCEPLVIVPPDMLQGARTLGEFTLVSCLVAPGFDFSDFVMPSREELLLAWPEHGATVRRFTRN